jgi:ubiquinone/menaquinone biosynthesis C-methylase UbiE
MTDRVRAIAHRYGGVARAYRSFWSPVMVALSQPLIEAMPLARDQRLLDLGCGVGTIASLLASRVDGVVGLDVSEGMLRRAPRDIARVAGDALRLPVCESSFDGAFSTFALQHVPFPGRALQGAAGAVRPGGFVATATWGFDHGESGGAYDTLDDVFARHDVPDEPAAVKTWHGRVDRAAKMRALARRAGLRVERAWESREEYRWSRAQFFGWSTSLGPYGRRLFAVDPARRAHALSDLQIALEALSDDDFLWRPLIVYMIAVNG